MRLVGFDLRQEFQVRLARQDFLQVLGVGPLVQSRPVDAPAMPGKLSDAPIEFQVRDVEFRLSGGHVFVDLLHELAAFLVVQLAAVLVDVSQVGGLEVARLVVTPLEPPDVEPVSRTRTVHAEQVVAHRDPFVDVLLHHTERHHPGTHHAL